MRYESARNHTGVIVDEVLKVIALAGVVGLTVVAPNSFVAVDKIFLKKLGRKKNKEAARIRNHMKRLDLVRVKENDDGSYNITLTKKGQKRATKARFDELSVKGKKWDGKWRIIMFDIPENHKKQRDFLSYHMKKIGFKQLQKSVFIFPYDSYEFLALVKETMPEVSNYLIYIESAEIDKHNDFVGQFSNIL